MVREVAAPGVQGHEDAGFGAEVAGICQQLQQRLAGGVEQGVDEPSAVQGPQRQQTVGDGEDDMEVRAGQQPGHLGVNPCLACGFSASRARPVATGVELHLGEVAGQAGQGVRAHGVGVAAGDGLGSTKFAGVQAATAGERVKALLEQLLKRTRRHRRCPCPAADQRNASKRGMSAAQLRRSNVGANRTPTVGWLGPG